MLPRVPPDKLMRDATGFTFAGSTDVREICSFATEVMVLLTTILTTQRLGTSLSFRRCDSHDLKETGA